MNDHKGFTLIELMIAVAIIALLAAIAIPSYNSSVMKSRRSDATIALSTLQLAEEKYRASNATYGTLAQLQAAGGGVSGTSSGGYYTITIPANTATGYTLTATPVAGKSQANDTSCAPITLTQAGETTTYAPITPTNCWK